MSVEWWTFDIETLHPSGDRCAVASVTIKGDRIRVSIEGELQAAGNIDAETERIAWDKSPVPDEMLTDDVDNNFAEQLHERKKRRYLQGLAP